MKNSAIMIGMMLVACGANTCLAAEEDKVLIGAMSDGWRYQTLAKAGYASLAEALKGEWTGLDYDDSAWKRGKASFGYGDEKGGAGYGTKINESVHLFRQPFTVTENVATGDYYLLLQVASDDSALIWINGQRVEKDPDFREGRKGHDFAYWNRKVVIAGSVLRPGRNVIACLMYNAPKSSDAYLDVSLSLKGRSKTPASSEMSQRGVSFYLPLDGTTEGLTPDRIIPSLVYLALDKPVVPDYGNGIGGKAARLGVLYLGYPAAEALDPHQGTLILRARLEKGEFDTWTKDQTEFRNVVQPRYKDNSLEKDLQNYYLVHAGEFFHLSLRDPEISNRFDDGAFHQIAITWQAQKQAQKEEWIFELYLDKDKVKSWRGKGTLARSDLLRLGWWDLHDTFRNNDLVSFDELAVWQRAMTKEDLEKHFERMIKKQSLLSPDEIPAPKDYLRPRRLEGLTEAKRPSLPKALNWDLVSEGKTATRTRYDLSGLWRLQIKGTAADAVESPFIPAHLPLAGERINFSPDENGWYYVELPIKSRRLPPNAYAIGKDGKLEGGSGLGATLMGSPVVWMERDFAVPRNWKEGRVSLHIKDVEARTGIYLNGQFLGDIHQGQGNHFDLTPHLLVGKVNRLSLLAGEQYPSVHIITRSEMGSSGTPLPWGTDKITLEYADQNVISYQDLMLAPKVEGEQLIVQAAFANRSAESQELLMTADILDGRTDKEVKTLHPTPFNLSGSFSGKKEIVLSFPDAHCWSPYDPYLYKTRLKILSGKDHHLLDEGFPIRFGFRELKSQGRDLLLNGKPFTHVENSHNTTLANEADVFRANIRRMKEMHWTGERADSIAFSPLLEGCLNVCDEEGWMIHAGVRSPRGAPKIFEGHLYLYEESAKQIGQHPSVCFWRMWYNRINPGGPQLTFCPGTLGSVKHLKHDLFDRYLKKIEARFRAIKEVSPNQLAYWAYSGWGSDMRALFVFWGYDVPLQTREEWPHRWAEEGDQPLRDDQVAFPLDCTYAFADELGGGVARARYRDPIIIEWASSYLGDRVYEKMPKKLVETYLLPEGRDKYWAPFAEGKDPGLYSFYYFPLKELYIKRNFRAWRTYRCGWGNHSVGLMMHAPDEEGRQPIWEAIKEQLRPVYAYVGGPKEDFVRKDHAYFSGSSIDNQIVFLNNYGWKKRVNAHWQLIEKNTGQVVQEKKQELVLEGGAVYMHPVGFKAPDVKEKKSLTIHLRIEDDEGEAHDHFPLQVFPAPANRPGQAEDVKKARILLYDPLGDTKKVLEKAGVKTEALDAQTDLSQYTLLVIGRKVFDQKLGEMLSQLKADAAIENGLNLLVFEQTGDIHPDKDDPFWKYWTGAGFQKPVSREETHLLQQARFPGVPFVAGLRMYDRTLRRAFVRAKDHPILQSLADEDFFDWRGATDMVEAYPRPELDAGARPIPKLMSTHLLDPLKHWHWSNHGMVSTFQMDKPQTGGYRVLLDGGFDMFYAALLERQQGKGTILFCQLDVTGRYGVDPVATLVVDRSLVYLCRRKGYPQVAGYMGGEEGKKVLEAIGAGFRQISELPQVSSSTLIVDARSELSVLKKDPDKLASWIKAGGNLVVLGASENTDIRWLPVKASIRKQSWWRGRTSGQGITSGLGPSEFHWRNVVELPLVDEVPDSGCIEADGLLADIPLGKGRIVLLQFDPFHVDQKLKADLEAVHQKAAPRYYTEGFNVRLPKAKALRIISAILTNLNVAFKVKALAAPEGISPYPVSPLVDASIYHWCTY